MKSRQTVGRRVRLLMADRQMKQRQLATAAGIGLGTVNRICQANLDGGLTVDTLELVADALNVTLSELFLPPGYVIIPAEGKDAGVVQWLSTPTPALGARFPVQEPPQPADIHAEAQIVAELPRFAIARDRRRAARG